MSTVSFTYIPFLISFLDNEHTRVKVQFHLFHLFYFRQTQILSFFITIFLYFSLLIMLLMLLSDLIIFISFYFETYVGSRQRRTRRRPLRIGRTFVRPRFSCKDIDRNICRKDWTRILKERFPFKNRKSFDMLIFSKIFWNVVAF